MAQYRTDAVRGRTLHLIEMNRRVNNRNAFLDITDVVYDAMRQDRKSGYYGVGPMAAIEIERARQYAEYVDNHPGT